MLLSGVYVDLGGVFFDGVFITKRKEQTRSLPEHNTKIITLQDY